MTFRSTPHPAQEQGPGSYLPQLDGLRFMAFLLVFVHHHGLFSGTPLHFLKEEGWVGVDLFFALSAFLFTRLLTAEIRQSGSISFRRFYLRRLLRIWPAYFVYLGICLSATLLFGRLSWTTAFERALGLVLFADNILAALDGFNPIFFTAHLWSICYEEQFYLALPPAIWLFSRLDRNRRIAGIAFLVGVGLFIKGFLIATGDAHISAWTLPWAHFESVALGAALAWKSTDNSRPILSGRLALALAVLCFGIQCRLPSAEISSFLLFPKYLFSALASVFLIHAAMNWANFSKGLAHPVLVHLGKRSYGLYLYHLASIAVVDRFIPVVPGSFRPGGLANFGLGLLLAWFTAYLSYRWLETPFLRLKKRFEVVASRPI